MTTIKEAANRMWDVLVRCANDKETIYYSDLATEVNLANQGTTKPLALIYKHCEKTNSVITGELLPPLTVLAVNKNDDKLCSECKKCLCDKCKVLVRRRGHPGKGYVKARVSVPMDSYAVFMHDWAKEPKPNFK